MASLLRKVRSQLNDIYDTGRLDALRSLRPDGEHSSPKAIRNSHCDLSTAVESSFSVQNRLQRQQRQQQQHDATSIAEFRRRLARKASTLSLRSKSRRTEVKGFHRQVLETDGSLAVENRAQHSISDAEHEPSNSVKSAGTFTPKRECQSSSSQNDSSPCATLRATPSAALSPITSRPESSVVRAKFPQDQDQNSQPDPLQIYTPDKTGWSKMASESAAPPVPYARLKDIATEACDTALQSITKYEHSGTEGWNTTIINTILAALVKETTPSSSSSSTTTSPAQPQFKYVVNSTIIQHASTTTSTADGATKASGRRGMHSASGAYWNNEKDGMWSFKYEAAEAKGLDVVVGIIWIWVG